MASLAGSMCKASLLGHAFYREVNKSNGCSDLGLDTCASLLSWDFVRNIYYRKVTKRKDCSDWIHVQGSSFGIANFAREEPATLQCLFLALTTVQLVNIF